MALTAKQFTQWLAFAMKGYAKKYNTLDYAAENNGIEELPIGHIIPYMGLTAPRHYLICDGAEYSTSEYPELFEHLLTFPEATRAQWGNADWSTKFNVPKLQGEFLRGAGTNGYAKQGGGAAVGVHQGGTEFPFGGHDGASLCQSPNANFTQIDSTAKSGLNYRWVGATGNNMVGRTVTSRPTNTSVLFCIRYEPSYNIKVEGKDIYSTEERVIGRWIDGKPIYRKVVAFGALPNAGRKGIAHGIVNLERVVSLSGMTYTTDASRYLVLPFSHPNSAGDGMALAATNTEIVIVTGIDRTTDNAIVNIEYTKTTD